MAHGASIHASDSTAAYAAGFFDGEGSVTIATRHSRSPRSPERFLFTVIVSVANSDPLIIEWFRRSFGGHRHGQIVRRGAPCRIVHHWMASNQVASAFLRTIQPHVRVKRTQVKLALQFLDGVVSQHMGRALTDAEYARQIRLYHEMRVANGVLPLFSRGAPPKERRSAPKAASR